MRHKREPETKSVGVAGKMLSLVRTCAPTDMGWDCKTGRTKGGHEVEVCHDTCDWDGCNPAPTILPALSLLVILLGPLLL